MNKRNIIILVVIIFIIISFSVGEKIGKLKYYMPLTNCISSDIPYEDYEIFKVSYPLNIMMQNYYTNRFTFIEMYAPKDITLKEYYPNFNNGGFHYFKTESNQIVECGLYK